MKILSSKHKIAYIMGLRGIIKKNALIFNISLALMVSFLVFKGIQTIATEVFARVNTHLVVESLERSLAQCIGDPEVAKICDLGERKSKTLSAEESRILVKHLHSKKFLYPEAWKNGVFMDGWGREFSFKAGQGENGLEIEVICNSKQYKRRTALSGSQKKSSLMLQ